MRDAVKLGEYRTLLLPDHPTPVELRTHTADPVPFVLFDSRKARRNEGAEFSEKMLEQEGLLSFEEGYRLMDYFIKDTTGK
jgi:2,3-bisphosphoglycerate-independent phosphoglycerate mutase